MSKAEKLRFWGLIGFSVLIRLLFLSRPSEPVFDELHYLPLIEQYLHGTIPALAHPPLGIMILAWGVKIFAGSPLGWRIFPALLGALGVALTYLVSRHLTKNPQSAFYAAFLLAFSFLWFTISRIAMLDIIVAVLFLGTVYCFLKKNYAVMGALAGCALATKWVVALPLLLLFGWLFRDILRNQKKLKPSDFLPLLTAPLLTAFVYWGINTLFYLDGGLLHFWQLQQKILSIHLFHENDLTYASPAWSWYLIPQAIPCLGEKTGFFKQIFLMENPALLWWGVLSLIWAGINLLQRKQTFLALPLLLWLSLFLPFLFMGRALYQFYIIPALPWLYLISGEALRETFGDSFWSRVYLGFIALSFLAFYPWMVIK